MDITVNKEEGKVVLNIDGRIDTTTAPSVEEEISHWIENAEELVLNLEKVAYISSAGLRVLLKTHKTMKENGRIFKLTAVNEEIMEIFEMTGFLDILTIES